MLRHLLIAILSIAGALSIGCGEDVQEIKARPPAAPRWPQATRDGRMVACLIERNGEPRLLDLWVAGVDGTDGRSVSLGVADYTGFDWTEDGSGVYLCRNSEIRRRDLSSNKESTVAVLPGDCLAVSTSPDGKWLAVIASDDLSQPKSCLYLVDVENAGVTVLVPPSQQSDEDIHVKPARPTWDAASREVAFIESSTRLVRSTSSSVPVLTIEDRLVSIDIRSKVPYEWQSIVSPPSLDYLLWIPASDALAYATSDEELWRVTRDGNSRKVLSDVEGARGLFQFGSGIGFVHGKRLYFSSLF